MSEAVQLKSGREAENEKGSQKRIVELDEI